MKTTDNRLIEWAVNETQTKYADDVSILLEHNTYCLEQDKGVRYVNTIISDSKRLIGLARTFIINGIGYDFNQVSWGHMERQAELKLCPYSTVLAEADIVYAKNEQDRQRFLYLKAKLNANLANPQYMFERGLEWLSEAMDIYKTMMFDESLKSARKGGNGIIRCLATGVACVNQTYFSSFTQLDELQAMKYLPDRFIEFYNKIVNAKSVTEIQSLCYDILKITRSFFKKFKKNDIRVRDISGEPNYEGLAEWYQECSYYFRRIYHFCDTNNPALALDGSCGIQTDLDELAKEFGLPDTDMLTDFDPDNLPAFAETVREVEKCIVSILESNNVRIDSYASVDEFVSKNS